jgi:hypothetical protein
VRSLYTRQTAGQEHNTSKETKKGNPFRVPRCLELKKAYRRCPLIVPLTVSSDTCEPPPATLP